jgi:hypothetical protein
MKMWTVITHLITCCVNLTFASIFRNENLLLYDGVEMQRLAHVGRELIRPVEDWSSIAKRGGRLLDVMFELEESIRSSTGTQFSIEDIVRKVSTMDNTFQGDFSLGPEGFSPWFDSGFENSTLW